MRRLKSTSQRTTRAHRRALSLLELIATAAIIAVVAGMAYATMAGGTLGNYGAKVAARQLAQDLSDARRRAISTGDDHFIRLQTSGGKVVSYTLRRTQGASSAVVDATRTIPTGVTFTMSPGGTNSPSFTFEGQAASAVTFTVAGADRSWQVSVIPVTGLVRVVEQ